MCWRYIATFTEKNNNNIIVALHAFWTKQLRSDFCSIFFLNHFVLFSKEKNWTETKQEVYKTKKILEIGKTPHETSILHRFF